MYDLSVRTASEIDLAEISCLVPEQQTAFVHLPKSKYGSPGQLLICKAGLLGGNYLWHIMIKYK